MSKQQTLTEDNLINDLRGIIISSREGSANEINVSVLMEKLTIYIVHRDHKVLEHGIKVGKESKS